MNAKSETKRIRSAAKGVKGSPGLIRAIVGHTDLVDAGKDLWPRGSVKRRPVVLTAYNHSSMAGQLPPGKGEVWEEQGHVILAAQFFVDTESGREHYLTLKHLGELAEFSVEYLVKDERQPTESERRRGAERVYAPDIFAVSPVTIGMMPDTGMVEIKCDGCCAARKAAKQPDQALDQEVDRIVAEGLALFERTKQRHEAFQAARREGDIGLIALDCAAKATRWLTLGRMQQPPLVKFFAPDGERAGYYSPRDADAIYISRDLPIEEIPEVVGHEVSHWLRPWDRGEHVAKIEAAHFARRYRESFHLGGAPA